MRCPKCGAAIGLMRQTFAVEVGEAAGVLCYMCGFWLQEQPKPER